MLTSHRFWIMEFCYHRASQRIGRRKTRTLAHGWLWILQKFQTFRFAQSAFVIWDLQCLRGPERSYKYRQPPYKPCRCTWPKAME